MKKQVLRVLAVLGMLVAFGLFTSCEKDSPTARTEDYIGGDHLYLHKTFSLNSASAGLHVTITHTFHTEQTNSQTHNYVTNERSLIEVDNFTFTEFLFTNNDNVTKSIFMESFKSINNSGSYSDDPTSVDYVDVPPGEYLVIYDYNQEEYIYE